MDDPPDSGLRVMVFGTNLSVVGLGIAQFFAPELGLVAVAFGLLVTVAGFAS